MYVGLNSYKYKAVCTVKLFHEVMKGQPDAWNQEFRLAYNTRIVVNPNPVAILLRGPGWFFMPPSEES